MTTTADAVAVAPDAERMPRPALRRPRAVLVTGVAEGLAAHLRWSRPAVRALFVVLSFFWGAGVLLYLWFWALMPVVESDPTVAVDQPTTHRAPVAWILATVAAISAVVMFGAIGIDSGDSPSWLAANVVTVSCAVGAGLWATLIDRRDPSRGLRHERAIRVVVTIVLAVVLLALLTSFRGAPWLAFFAAIFTLLGIAAVYSSTLIDKLRDLSRERVRRIREEQRSEMAAHLHDSVLQTLALIQNRAGASSEVARLARAQERELRSWLFDGDTPADSDLATDLRDYAAALELDYPVHIEVVSAGTSTERASGEVAAAAREAMLNASRHAGGEVSVYIEGAGATVDVYVRDRGPGFDLAEVPGDRLGVRQSIIGRMRRVGGSATVGPGVGGAGTQVHLRFERADGAHG
ncbi:hypothetical protein ASD65_16235 [Microbacterium sp. Root61]|uniref:ATP-binding protein n=1 Tax=Microbacterium sp. Root61 TaxID=1736570 RepID=UPI0006FBF0B9|nr:ATP-binding protein [Microbacterium sp. Root61]KRA25800.1 hypothetical protein ASD65_16235 [Microbacterium sp. Root61]